MKNTLLLLAVLTAGLRPGRADAAAPITLAPMFRDHAVLQRDVPLPIWGTAEPGSVVEIRIFPTRQPPETADRQVDTLTNAVVGADGRWSAVLPAFPATPANTIPNVLMVDYVAPAGEAGATIALGAASAPDGAGARAEDILFGDVWLCSGQSNMDMNYGWGLTRGKEDVETNTHARIRLFDDHNRTALSPQRDLPDDYGWTPCDPANAKSFSAVGYFFGQALQEAMPDVPIGLIEASWSGSPIKTWIPYEAAESVGGAFGEEAARRRAIAKAWENGGRDQFQIDLAAWTNTLPALDPGDAPAAPDFDDSDWQIAKLPEITEKHTSQAFDGWVWYRKTFVLGDPDPDYEYYGDLLLGPIDDRDWTYFNGELVGSTNLWDASRKYLVYPRPGTNTIAVKVLDWGGHGGLWTKDSSALRLDLWECYGGDDPQWFDGDTGEEVPPIDPKLPSVPLAGEWKFKAFPAEPRPVDPSSPSSWDVAACHNGMVAPLFGMAAKGAIWYQGCSDVGSADLYAKQFPAMVGAWREGFVHDDAGFPVYLVQLAAFKETHPEPIDSAWARMRWTQMRLGETVPHCGTAVAIDVGDHRDIHPKDKKTVGERLARLALARTYGRPDVVEAGPIPDPLVMEPGDRFGCTVHNGGVDSEGRDVVDACLYIGFRNDKGGLKAREGGLIRGFQAKIDGVWTAVEADEHVYYPESGETCLVQLALPPNTDPESVTAVRYAWDDYPDCNLVNGEGLPCGPFELEIEP